MSIVGYDDSIWCDINGNGVAEAAEKGAFKVANSWGTGWGHEGDCYIPAAYLEKYGSDFWTIATNNE